jgi:ATPase subunit of ABC transporter with duplicated ATPase domains
VRQSWLQLVRLRNAPGYAGSNLDSLRFSPDFFFFCAQRDLERRQAEERRRQEEEAERAQEAARRIAALADAENRQRQEEAERARQEAEEKRRIDAQVALEAAAVSSC